VQYNYTVYTLEPIGCPKTVSISICIHHTSTNLTQL